MILEKFCEDNEGGQNHDDDLSHRERFWEIQLALTKGIFQQTTSCIMMRIGRK